MNTTIPFLIRCHEGYKIFCTVHECGSHRATYVGIQNIQRFGCSFISLVKKLSPVLFTFNARFANQQKCRARTFAKVPSTFLVLQRMNTFHFQKAEVAVHKLEHTTCRWKLRQVGRIRSMHLRKIYLI